MADTYKEAMVMQFPNMTARIYSPKLTAEERARRMREIHKAAAALLAERK